MPHYPIRCVDSISAADGYELIIVPTNAQQVEDALKSLAPVAGDATVLIFSGNWDGLAAYDAILPREQYLVGYADGGGTIRDGFYWTNLGPEVHLGLVEGQSAERLERVKATFARADLKADEQGNMVHSTAKPPTPTPEVFNPLPPEQRAFEAAREVLAGQLGLDPLAIRLVEITPVDWPDACLGCLPPVKAVLR